MSPHDHLRAQLFELLQEELATAQREERLAEEQSAEQTEDPSASEHLWPAVDLASVVAELAALKTEVRAETEATRQSRQVMEELATTLQEAPLRPKGQEQEEQALKQARRQTGRVLIDLADRLEQACQHANKLKEPRRRWWHLFRAPLVDPRVEALSEGLQLTLERIKQHLADYGLQRISARGRSFDPVIMECLDVVQLPDEEDGVVVEEITAGYRSEEGVLRPAQVLVNRKTKSPSSTGEESFSPERAVSKEE